MYRKRLTLIVLMGLGLLLAASAGTAGEKYSGTGHFMFVIESENFELPDGGIASRQTNRGFAFYGNEKHPFHKASQNCWGTFVGDQQTGTQGGYCTIVPLDRAGIVWVAFTGNQDGGQWHVLHGIGSLEGITGKGTWKAGGPGWVDGKGENTAEGTIELP